MRNAPQLGIGAKADVALSLTALGGFVDAVGYIALFQIFTANMSGNSVYLGMYLGRGDLLGLLRPLCAVAAYVIAMIATRIALGIAERKPVSRIASFLFALEAVLLIVFARATPAMHLGVIVDLRSAAYFSLVALLAFAMGVQTATLTHIGALTVYTTFVTGTLTRFTESFTRALFWTYDRWRLGGSSGVLTLAGQQPDVREAGFLLATWMCYVVGAALGSIFKSRWELRALYLPVAVLLVLIVIDQIRPIAVEEEKHQQG